MAKTSHNMPFPLDGSQASARHLCVSELSLSQINLFHLIPLLFEIYRPPFFSLVKTHLQPLLFPTFQLSLGLFNPFCLFTFLQLHNLPFLLSLLLPLSFGLHIFQLKQGRSSSFTSLATTCPIMTIIQRILNVTKAQAEICNQNMWEANHAQTCKSLRHSTERR